MGQRKLWSLVNKGEEYVELLLHTQANDTVRHVLGEEYQLSHATATIATESQQQQQQQQQDLQMDQWWLPQPLDKAAIAPEIRPGSITPALVYDVTSASPDVIAPAVSLDVLWSVSYRNADSSLENEDSSLEK